MSPTVLEQIAQKTEARIIERKKNRSLASLIEICKFARKPGDFAACFKKNQLAAIAEIKFSSPSQGVIAMPADPVRVAQGYLDNGASALSILTEQDYFNGKPEYLREVRKAFPHAFILMKDFVVDPYQIYEALELGADAVLLIVALLGKEKTHEFLNRARTLGLTALVEVHDREELAIALDIGSTLIGVNNRNLKDLKVSLSVSHDLVKLVGARPGISLISESGISTPEEVMSLKNAGFSGILVGTSLMQSQDAGLALKHILTGAQL